MPFHNLDELKAAPSVGQPFVPEVQKEADPRGSPSWFETVGAFFANEFTPTAAIGAASEAATRLTETQDDGFDAFEELRGTDLEAYADQFVDVFNRPQYERRVKSLRSEMADRDIIERSGLMAQLSAGLVTGAFDPVNYIAFGGTIGRGLQATRRLQGAKNLLWQTGKAGFVSAAAEEAVLQADQRMRTWEESVSSIAMSTVFSAGLGGAFGAIRAPRAAERVGFEGAAEGYFRRTEALPNAPDPRAVEVAMPETRTVFRETDELVPGVQSIGEDGVARPVYRRERVTEDVTTVARETNDAVPPAGLRRNPVPDEGTSWSVSAADEGASLSAAKAPEVDTRLAGGKVVEALVAPSRKLGRWATFVDNPTGRMLTSPLGTARRTAERLANVGRLTKNQDVKLGDQVVRPGIATSPSVEAAVGYGRGLEADIVTEGRHQYTLYRGARVGFGGRTAMAVSDLTQGRAGMMSEPEFKAAAYDVVRDGVPHGSKEVNALAEKITGTLDRLRADAIAVKALDANVDPVTAKNYIMRVYDRPQIVARRRVFEAVLTKWMRENADRMQAEAENARKIVSDIEGSIEKLNATMTPDELRIATAEGRWRESQVRVDRASKVFDDLVAEYHGATDQLRALETAPDVVTRKDQVAAARRDANVIESDMNLAMKEHEAAKAARDAARNTYDIYVNTIEKWPGKLKKAIVERRRARLETLGAQAATAKRSLKRLEAELDTMGGAPRKYAEWLDLRSQTMPKGKRPASLLEYLIAKGGVKDASGELRSIVRKSVKSAGGGEADARFALSKLISKDERSPSLDDATLDAWESGYIGVPGDGEFAERPEINVLLDALDGEAGGGGKVYSHQDFEEIQRWEEWDYIRERKQDLQSDPDFRGGREITRLLNKWRARAAHRLAEIEREGTRVLRERDEAQAWLDAQAARAREVEKARRDLRSQLEHERKRADDFEGIAFKSDEDMGRIVRELSDELLGMPGQPTARGIDNEMQVKRRGPLADRTLLIPDDYDAGPMIVDGAQESGRFDQFVVKDTDRVMAAVIRNMVPDIELHRQFGSVDLADEKIRISEDAEALRASLGRQKEIALGKAPDDAAKAKIEKRFNGLMKKADAEARDMLQVLDVQVQRLRGTFTNGVSPDSMWLRFAENAKALNYIRLMGKAVVASVADPMMIAHAHGLPRLLAALRGAITDWPAFVQSMRTAGGKYGQAVDLALSVRTSAIADMNSSFVPKTKAETTLHWMSQRFGNLNLLGPWTDFWKTMDVNVAQDRILRNVEKAMDGTGLDEKEWAYMRDHFLGPAEIASIWNQRQHNKTAAGLRMAETLDWDDDGARRIMSAAINKDADFNIITPGLEKPIWFSTTTGSVIGQFKSFTYVAMNRILVSSLQRQDAQAAQGIGLLLAGGALSYLIASALKGHDPFQDPPSKWAAEAIDRSGMVGYLAEVNAFADKIGIGANSLLGGREVGRYASRSAADQLFGPTFGAMMDSIGIASAAFNEEVDLTGGDLGKVRQMIPGNNLFFAEWLGNAVERGAADAIGIEPRAQIRAEPKGEFAR